MYRGIAPIRPPLVNRVNDAIRPKNGLGQHFSLWRLPLLWSTSRLAVSCSGSQTGYPGQTPIRALKPLNGVLSPHMDLVPETYPYPYAGPIKSWSLELKTIEPVVNMPQESCRDLEVESGKGEPHG